MFDHQMVIDSEAQIIYVSGGRVVDGDWESMKFAGLYSFDIRRNSWKLHQSVLSSFLHILSLLNTFLSDHQNLQLHNLGYHHVSVRYLMHKSYISH